MRNVSNPSRATMIAAPGSGHGKTLFTAAVARSCHRKGQKVRVFKIGPDYLDPMVLQVACGEPVLNLDWWMMGEQACEAEIQLAAQTADIVLVESLMGLFDNEPSNAEFSHRFQLPVTLLMDMSKFAQTAAAVVYGMQQFDRRIRFSGVVGNRLGSQHHQTLVREAMTPSIPYAGSMRRDERLVLPERHLGLVQAQEIEQLDSMLDAAADCLDESEVNLDLPLYPPSDSAAMPNLPPLLQGRKIAIARDRAFAFIYPANTELLEKLGASLHYFSPLADEPVPECDALWLPGGYPELHLDTLSANTVAMESLENAVRSGLPGLAECGGMMVLGKSIETKNQTKAEMVGVFNGMFTMQQRFQSVGYEQLDFAGAVMRGHSFHHSVLNTPEAPVAQWQKRNGNAGEKVYRSGKMLLTYAHSYFGSCPEMVARIFAGEL